VLIVRKIREAHTGLLSFGIASRTVIGLKSTEGRTRLTPTHRQAKMAPWIMVSMKLKNQIVLRLCNSDGVRTSACEPH
jgi:hypothetical protein